MKIALMFLGRKKYSSTKSRPEVDYGILLRTRKEIIGQRSEFIMKTSKLYYIYSYTYTSS